MIRASLWLGALCLFFYICWLLGPIYISNYQFQDALREVVHFAAAEHKDQEQVAAEVYREAGELGLPVKPEDIEVAPIPGGYRITVRYEVKLEILHHPIYLHLSPAADSNSI